MKILVVDDERTFNNLSGDITYARSSNDAICALIIGDYDVILLDHDLGGDDTTINVARYIKEENIPSVIMIHTQNPVGRKNLLLELPYAKQILNLREIL